MEGVLNGGNLGGLDVSFSFLNHEILSKEFKSD